MECPVCEEQVEKSISDGNKSKTCGNNDCRTAAMKYNSNIDEKTGLRIIRRTQKYSPSKEVKTSAEFLYMFDCKQSTKIGIATNIKKRLSTLSAMNPFEVTEYFSIKVNDPRKLEAYLHKLYKDNNIKYEWFSFSEKEKTSIVEYINKSVQDENWEGATLVREYLSSKLIKPIVETITNQDISHIVPKKSKEFIGSITKHGLVGTKIYIAWQTMKASAKSKGTTVCNLWIDSPEIFASDMQSSYDSINEKPALVLIDKTGIYSKSNCKIITISEASGLARAKAVNQLTLDGEFVNSFNNAVIASKITGCNSSKINAVCNGKRKTSGGFKWEFAS